MYYCTPPIQFFNFIRDLVSNLEAVKFDGGGINFMQEDGVATVWRDPLYVGEHDFYALILRQGVFTTGTF